MQNKIGALTLVLTLCATIASAQGSVRARTDSIRKVIDSLVAVTDSTVAERHRMRERSGVERVVFADSTRRKALHSTPWFAGILSGGVLANAVWPIDRDAGGYRDSWITADKWWHYSVGTFLVERADMMGVPLRWAVPMTCVAAVGWEVTQGYVSGKDITVGCAGAMSGAVFRLMARKVDRTKARFGW